MKEDNRGGVRAGCWRRKRAGHPKFLFCLPDNAVDILFGENAKNCARKRNVGARVDRVGGRQC